MCDNTDLCSRPCLHIRAFLDVHEYSGGRGNHVHGIIWGRYGLIEVIQITGHQLHSTLTPFMPIRLSIPYQLDKAISDKSCWVLFFVSCSTSIEQSVINCRERSVASDLVLYNLSKLLKRTLGLYGLLCGSTQDCVTV